MKNFVKKIAFVLALAMVITSFGPAASAKAAATPSLKYSSKVIYVGGSADGKYNDNCWTPSQDNDGYTVSYKVTEGEDIIDVTKNGKITANGNGIGKAVVEVTYSKAGTKDIVKNFTVKVRRNATDVRLRNVSIAALEEALTVGSEVKLTAAKSFVGKSYKTGNFGVDNYTKVVSDQIAYQVTEGEDVIEIVGDATEGYTLKAIGAGEATFVVYTYPRYQSEDDVVVTSVEYKVTVVGGMTSAEQKSLTTLEVVMGDADDAKNAKASDFEIVRTVTKDVVPVKSVNVKAGTDNVLVVETYNDVRALDGVEGSKDFTIEYKNEKYPENIVTFEATDAVIRGFALNRTTIPADYETKMEVNLLDGDGTGVVIATVALGDYYSGLEFDIDAGSHGWTSGNTLYISEVGKTAKATVIYRTGEYESGIEKVIEKSYTITAVKDSAQVESVKYVVKSNGNFDNIAYTDWDGINESSRNDLAVRDEETYLFAYVVSDGGLDFTKDRGCTFQSTNEDVLVVGPYYETSKGIAAEIIPVKAGTVYVNVMNDKTVVATLKVIVKAERKLANVTADVYNLTVSNSIGLDYVDRDQKPVVLAGLDQYGDTIWSNDLSYAVNPQFDTSKYPNHPFSDGVEWERSWDGKYTLEFSGWTSAGRVAAGTYKYTVVTTYKNVSVSRTVTVTVKAPAQGTITNDIVFKNTDVAATDANDKDLEIRVAEYKGGVLNRYHTITSVELTRGGKKQTVKGEGSNKVVMPIIETRTSVTGDIVSGTIIKKAQTGNYTAKVKYDINKTSTKTVTLTDSQAFSFSMKKNTFDLSNLYNEIIMDAFKFAYSKDGVNKNSVDSPELFSVFGLETQYPVNGSVTVDSQPTFDYVGNNDRVVVKKVQVYYNVDADIWVPFTISTTQTLRAEN